MLQISYGKNGTKFDIIVPDDFQAELDALSPRMAYCAEYGIKQSVADAYAAKGLKPNEIIGKGLKKWDAIVAGTVRVAGSGERQPTRTPMEREIWRIASADMAKVFEKNAKKGNAIPKAKQAHYIRQWIERHWDELNEKAAENLANADTIQSNAEDDLDELLYGLDEEDEDEAEAA